MEFSTYLLLGISAATILFGLALAASLFRKRALESVVFVSLPQQIDPDGRDDTYDKPLSRFLADDGLGRLLGATTRVTEAGDIVSIDLRVSLRNLDEHSLDRLVTALETLGAPKGSEIRSGVDEVLRRFGTEEGLAIFLDASNSHGPAYSEHLTEDLAALCSGALEDCGVFKGSRRIAGHIALYFYGRSFAEMRDAVADILDAEPAGENAEIRQLA